MLKKSLSLILICVLIFAVGCTKAPQIDENKTSVVCTSFAAFDWVRNITRGVTSVGVSLLGGGQDLHSFQPGAKDIADIHNSKLVICLGGQSDLWVEDIENIEGKTLALFDVVGRENLIIPSHDHHEGHQHADHEFDEHIWLSLNIANACVEGICEKLCSIDPGNDDIYRANTKNYCKKLEDLDEKYQKAVDSSESKTVVFADRYPFAYMMQDYEIECFAAFDGCSADTDATFETVLELADAVKSHDKNTVAVLESSNDEIVRAIRNALNGAEVNSAQMNSMQTMLKEETSMQSYIDIMEKNLESLKMALR